MGSGTRTENVKQPLQDVLKVYMFSELGKKGIPLKTLDEAMRTGSGFWSY